MVKKVKVKEVVVKRNDPPIDHRASLMGKPGRVLSKAELSEGEAHQYRDLVTTISVLREALDQVRCSGRHPGLLVCRHELCFGQWVEGYVELHTEACIVAKAMFGAKEG